MTDLLAEAALASTHFTEVLLALKATTILSIVLLGIKLRRRGLASERHLLLASAFGVLLILPIASLLLPPVTFQVSIGPTAAVEAAEGDVAAPVLNLSEGHPVQIEESFISRLSLAQVALGAGAIVFFLPLALELWWVQRLRRQGLPCLAVEQTAQLIARRAAIRRPVAVLLHADVMVPLTCGWLHPAIVLPLDAPQWSDTDLRRAIVHELEHVRRADWLVRLASRAVCALYWFHPLAWIAWRRLCLESERAADDAVLDGAERTDYAEQLITLAARLVHSPSLRRVSMANRSDLALRVSAILDNNQRRGRTGVCRAAATIAASALMLALAPMRAIPSQIGAIPSGEKTLAFEVASVKPTKTSGLSLVQFYPGGRLSVTNMSVSGLIKRAFRLQDNQLVGATGWVNSESFDIEAKGETTASGDQMLLMLQTLLADRFGLRARTETRELPIYALVVANASGKMGPQLRPAVEGTCDDAPLLGAPERASDQPARPRCGLYSPTGRWTGRGTTADSLAATLSRVLGRVVVNRTGITGKLDLDLQWTELSMLFAPTTNLRDGMLTTGIAPAPPPPADGPSLPTALQEQLGLRLETQKGLVEVLVIDSVRRAIEQ